MTEIKADSKKPEVKKSMEFMTKMMLMNNSKTTGYADSVYFYKKNIPNTGR